MKNNFSHSWRAHLIYIFLGISLLILVFRIVSLQYIEGDFLVTKGKNMLETSRSIPANRGSILDRNNFPLAVSINQYDCAITKQSAYFAALIIIGSSVVLVKSSSPKMVAFFSTRCRFSTQPPP